MLSVVFQCGVFSQLLKISSWHVLQVSAPTYLESSGEGAAAAGALLDETLLAGGGGLVWPEINARPATKNKTGDRRIRDTFQIPGIRIRTLLDCSGLSKNVLRAQVSVKNRA